MTDPTIKTVWIVSELYYPSETSTGFIMTKLAESLANQYKMNVLTGPTSYTSDSGKYALQESVNQVNINRVKLGFYNKNSIFKRVLRLSILSIKLGIGAFRRIEKDSTLIVVTNPVPLLFLISLIKRIKKDWFLIVLVHDVYPENMIAAGILKKKGVVFKCINFLYSSALKSADNVVVLGRDMKEVIEAKGAQNTRIIESWAETDQIQPDPSIGKHNDEQPLRYLFAGNLGRVQGIPVLLEAIKLIDPNVATFVFAGNGACAELLKEASLANSEQIKFLGSYERREQKRILNSCDIGIVTLAKGMYGLGVPSKAYNLMAAGKPILFIGDRESEIDRVVLENNCGWVVNESDPEAIAEAILKISSEPHSELTARGSNSLSLATEVFTLDNVISKYRKLLQEIT